MKRLGPWGLLAVLLLFAAFAGGGLWHLTRPDSASATAVITRATPLPTPSPPLRATRGALQAGVAGNDAMTESETSTDPAAQTALWKKRLARAEEVLAHYRSTTRYPHESRSLDEHSDQSYPNRPVLETKKLAKPGDKITDQTVRLNTSQERIFVVGKESVLFTATAVDQDGNVLPMIASQAIAFDPPQQGQKPSKRPRVGVSFNDLGFAGDVAANDGTLSLQFSPQKQGFADHTGAIRIEVLFKVGEQTGFTFFDLYYTPLPPAEWAGEGMVREALENGSLNLYLKAEVYRAGRYVIAGRIDDARGKPFALAVFNDEVKEGKTEFKLTIFGKLIRDKAPVFPLVLRDVDGFLLKADTFPDRDLVPRRQDKIYTTKSYSVSVFSDAEWQSEERERHLREFANDVAIARERLDALGAPTPAATTFVPKK